jgi:YbbR domain-containing protein
MGALTTAILIWFFTAYQTGIIEKSFNVPVVLENIPNNILIENYSPKEVRVTVSGRGDSIFSNVTASDFDIDFDVADIEDGLSKMTLTNKNIEVPSNLTLLKFEPESFLLTAKKYYTAKLPVKAITTGSVPDGFELKSIVVTPEFVEVWVPQDASVPAEVVVETIDVSNTEESVIIPVKMVVPEEVRLVSDDDTVNVALTIEDKE